MLDEKHQKYKFMETNLINRRRRLKGQIPDIKSSLIMIEHLRAKSESKDEIESHFLISDQAYSKATIPPTDKVTIIKYYTCKMIECNIKFRPLNIPNNSLTLMKLTNILGVSLAGSECYARIFIR